jgi:hypothetical protein
MAKKKKHNDSLQLVKIGQKGPASGVRRLTLDTRRASLGFVGREAP